MIYLFFLSSYNYIVKKKKTEKVKNKKLTVNEFWCGYFFFKPPLGLSRRPLGVVGLRENYKNVMGGGGRERKFNVRMISFYFRNEAEKKIR